MKFVLFFIIVFSSISVAMATQHQYLGSLGSSLKGQFVALEEFAYRPESHGYYVTIRLINVWNGEDVGSPIVIETSASDPTSLSKARAQAKVLSALQFKKYKIILR